MNLTAEQLECVKSTESFIVVEAGPGSGKTSVLAHRISDLLRRGIDPEKILALTFTRSACANIRKKVAGSIGELLAARVKIQTFHAFAYDVVRKVRGHLSVATERQTEVAFQSLYNGATRRKGVTPKRKLRAGIMAYEAVGPFARDSRVDETIGDINRLLGRLMDADLVPTWALTVLAMMDRSEVAAFDHVLVDEVQDCTESEWDMACVACGFGNLFAVGDPRQAIMGWRGARPWNYEITHRLTQSFRFSSKIAAAANDLAVKNGWGTIKGTSEPGEIIRSIPLDVINLYSGTRAVLCRTHEECRMIASTLENAIHVERRTEDPMDCEADRFDEIAKHGLIAVSTVHAAKGREWDHVAVSLVPGGDDEEKRVRYVALTRARTTLLIC